MLVYVCVLLPLMRQAGLWLIWGVRNDWQLAPQSPGVLRTACAVTQAVCKALP
jgi:hypothetical protein